MSRLPRFVLRTAALLLVASTVSGCPAAIRKPWIRDRAESYFKAGQYDKAKIEYMKLLRLDQQNVAAYERLGTIWFEEGALLRAIPFFRKVCELAPNNVEARSKLALAFIGLGGLKQARNEALTILEKDPGNADAIGILADTDQTRDDIAVTEQHIQAFPNHDTAAFHLASARLAMRKNNLGEMTEHIERGLALDPKSPSLHLAMGYVYLARQDITRAGDEFKTAAEVSPLRSGSRIRYIEFQLAHGAPNDAKTALHALTEKVPDFLPAWTMLARLAMTDKKYDEAVSLVENVFFRDSDNFEGRILQAEALLGKGDTTKAVAVLERLDTVYPNNPVVKYQLGRAYLATKNFSQAATALKQAIAAKPDYFDAIIALAELALRAGQTQDVVSAMEQLLSKRPELSEPRRLLASAYLALNRLDDAANLYREQIRNTPQSAEPYFLLGMILRQQKKNDEAREAFEKSAELTPDNLSWLDQLVEMDLADKRFDAALERVQQELSKKPGSAYAHLIEGKVYTEKRDWEHAEAAFRKATQLDPTMAVAYNALVGVYVAANKLPQAISELESMLQKNPNNAELITMTGLVYDKMQNHEKARAAYEKLLALKPDSVIALNNLAYIYGERLNQLDRASELAQKARNILPDDASIADTLGWILYKRADYQQALPLLQEAAGKLAQNPAVQFHLGMAYYMMGQAEPARSALQKAAAASVDFPDKAEAERRLAQLAEPGGGVGDDASIEQTEALLKRQPNDPILLSRLAVAYEKAGQSNKAAENYEKALKLNAKLPGVAMKLAQLYAGPLKDRDKALDYAKKARELAPNDTQTAGILGQIAFQAGNFSWSYSLLQESARQQRNNSQTLFDLAWAAYALGKAPEASRTMQQALEVAPSGPRAEEAKRFLAMTALDQVSPDVVAAEGEIEKILQTEPDYIPALVAQAAAKLQGHDSDGAAAIYARVLQKYPDFAPAQKRLAAVYADKPDDAAKAYDLAMKARKALPDDPEVARTLAELTFARNDFSYAIQLFQQSAAKQPLPAKDLYFLGMAQLQTKQEAKGRETLGRAVAAGLPEPFAQQAKQRLASPTPTPSSKEKP